MFKKSDSLSRLYICNFKKDILSLGAMTISVKKFLRILLNSVSYVGPTRGCNGKWQFVRKSESEFERKSIVENFRNFSVENFRQ